MRINEHHEIDLSEIRPHFKLISSMHVDEVVEYAKTAISNSNPDGVRGSFQHHHIHFKVPEQYEHYWSPVLHVGIEKNEEREGTLLRCMIGPSQGVWAMFILVYGAIGILTLFGLFYGGTKYQVEGDSTWLWSLPIALVLFFAIWISAKIGQRKGHHQMDELIHFFLHTMEKGTIKNYD